MQFWIELSWQFVNPSNMKTPVPCWTSLNVGFSQTPFKIAKIFNIMFKNFKHKFTVWFGSDKITQLFNHFKKSIVNLVVLVDRIAVAQLDLTNEIQNHNNGLQIWCSSMNYVLTKYQTIQIVIWNNWAANLMILAKNQNQTS